MFKVLTKFPAMTFRTRSAATGWPDGCNALACETLRQALEYSRTIFNDVDGLLLIEPDCVPISYGWIYSLWARWRDARNEGRLLMGAWRQSGPECGHINGNAMFVPDILERIPGLLALPAHAIAGTAWDAAFAPFFKPHWAFTGLISNRWNETNLTEQQILTPWIGTAEPVLIHGVKDDSVWDFAIKRLGL